MRKTNAEYQRAYRARKKVQPTFAAYSTEDGATVIDANKRIAELEAEVAHLKRQLAARPAPAPAGEMRPVQAIETGHRFNSRPFTPVPKR